MTATNPLIPDPRRLTFRAHNKPTGVRESRIITDRARAAWDRLNKARDAHERLVEQDETAARQAAQARQDHAEKLRDAAIAGKPLNVDTPPEHDPQALTPQMEALIESARGAAEELHAAMVEAVPEGLTLSRALLEKRETQILDLLTALETNLVDYASERQDLGFFHQLEQDPNHMPLGFGAPRISSDAAQAIETIRESLTWRVDDLEHQITRAVAQGAPDDEIAALDTARQEARLQLDSTPSVRYSRRRARNAPATD